MDIVKGLSGLVANVVKIIKEASKIALSLAGKIIKKLILCHIILIIIWIVVAVRAADKIGTCYEEDEFLSTNMTIPAYHDKVDNYRHEEFSQLLNITDMRIKGYTLLLDGEPISIRIKGQWTPWFGENNEESGDIKIISSDIRRNVSYCSLNRIELGKDGYNFKYSYMTEKKDENIFYYISNYYNHIKPFMDYEKNKIKYEYVVSKPTNQQGCWITRGAGLYLGAFGTDGKHQSTEYHHMIGSTMNCPNTVWFNNTNFEPYDKEKNPTGDKNGEKWKKFLKEENFVNTLETLLDLDLAEKIKERGGEAYLKQKDIEEAKKNRKKKAEELAEKIVGEYTYRKFIENIFGFEHFLKEENKLENMSNEDKEKAKNIYVNDGYKIMYNIDLHEELLNKYKINDVGGKIGFAMAKFNNACYYEKRNSKGEIEVVKNNAYFTYGPKELRRHYTNYSEKYKYGEEIGFFILDKNYNDNIGGYTIDILSGIQYDTTGTIQDLLKNIEFKLLGTPRPNSDKDRTDGFLARIYLNILNSNFATIFRVVLTLFIMVYGYKMLMGLTEGGDKQLGLLQYKELIPYVIKCALIMALTSETGFIFFNKTFINFIINGTIGAIDLVRSVYAESFDTNENLFFLSGGLENANQVLSLSRNFAILDEILAMLKSDVLLIKILSLYFTGDFMFSVVGTVLMFYAIGSYIISLLGCLIPYIFILIQWAVVLPLAPIMLLFSLFKNTQKRFESWLKFCIGKSLEMFVFFTAFYLWTGIINNQVKSILSFKVCVKRLSQFLFGKHGWDVTVTVVTLALVGTVIMGLLKTYSGVSFTWGTLITYTIILTGMMAFMIASYWIAYFEMQGGPDAGVSVLGMSTSKSFYKDYIDFSSGTGLVFSLLVLLVEVKLFETMIKDIGGIFSKIFTIAGATSSNKIASEVATGVKNNITNFAQTMGLDEMQKTDIMSWSRSFMDLSDAGGGIMGNVERLAENNPLSKAAEIQMNRLGNGLNAMVETGFDRLANTVEGKENEKIDHPLAKAFMEGVDKQEDDKGGSFSKTFMEQVIDDSELGKGLKSVTDFVSNNPFGAGLAEKLDSLGRKMRDENKDKETAENRNWKNRYKDKNPFEENIPEDKKRERINKIFNQLKNMLLERMKKNEYGYLTAKDYEDARKFLQDNGIHYLKDGTTLKDSDLDKLFNNGFNIEDGNIYTKAPVYAEEYDLTNNISGELDKFDDPMFSIDDSFSLGGEDARNLGGEDGTQLGGEDGTQLTNTEGMTNITDPTPKQNNNDNKKNKLDQYKENNNPNKK